MSSLLMETVKLYEHNFKWNYIFSYVDKSYINICPWSEKDWEKCPMVSETGFQVFQSWAYPLPTILEQNANDIPEEIRELLSNLKEDENSNFES